MKNVKWVIIFVFLLPFILLLLNFTYTVIKNSYWDEKVRDFCEEDGGITVYEKVVLTPEDVERYSRHGRDIYVPLEDHKSKYQSPYYYSNKTTMINKDEPLVRKSVSKLRRERDGMVMAERVYFGRSGHAFWGLMMPGFGCKDVEGYVQDIESLVFTVQGEENGQQ